MFIQLSVIYFFRGQLSSQTNTELVGFRENNRLGVKSRLTMSLCVEFLSKAIEVEGCWDRDK